MKILIHSNGPMVPSGYGRQTALLLRQFTGLGHDVAVSAFHGLSGSAITWEGVPIFPAGQVPFGLDVLLGHAQHFGADLILTLMDVWKLLPLVDSLAGWRKDGHQLAYWMPVDCTPLGQGDRLVLERAGGHPVAMSRFGHQRLIDAGFPPFYVPHSVDTAVYRPRDEAVALRAELGAPDEFVVGICAANRDAVRKAWPEQFRAFALHLRDHPDSALWVHTLAGDRNGLPLRDLAHDMGISHVTRFTDDYPQVAGWMDDDDMATWYSALDQLLNCSYAEGFGLPILEAQACGTPALATRASAMAELAHDTVSGQEFWNPVHRAWWRRPDTDQIAAKLGYDRAAWSAANRHQELVDAAAAYDVHRVAEQSWRPVLDALEGGA